MSEFSEAYFLRSNRKEDAIQLLERANLAGYVYPARDGWTAFVANTNPIFKFSEELKAANLGILLQYVNAEDHGWGFEICVDQKSVCGYYCGFNEDMEAEELYQISRELDESGFEKFLAENEEFAFLRKYFDENAKTDDIRMVHDFTQMMKLYFSDWISYHYADLQGGEFPKYGEYENLKLVKVG